MSCFFLVLFLNFVVLFCVFFLVIFVVLLFRSTHDDDEDVENSKKAETNEESF